MRLRPEEAQVFLHLYKNLLNFIFLNESGEEIGSIDEYREARDILYEDTRVVDKFIDVTHNLKECDIEILKNIKNGMKGTFVYLKTLKKHSLLLSGSTNKIYCVLGITDPVEELVPGTFSIVETAIFNFGQHIICDGLVSCENVIIGPNMRKDINAQYKKAKENEELIRHITITSS